MRKEITIRSQHHEGIQPFILTELHRSATVYRAHPAFTREPQEVLTTVLSRRKASAAQFYPLCTVRLAPSLKVSFSHGLIEGFSVRKEITIRSQHHEGIQPFILTKLHRNATVYRAHPAFTREPQEVLTTVLSRRQAICSAILSAR